MYKKGSSLKFSLAAHARTTNLEYSILVYLDPLLWCL